MELRRFNCTAVDSCVKKHDNKHLLDEVFAIRNNQGRGKLSAEPKDEADNGCL